MDIEMLKGQEDIMNNFIKNFKNIYINTLTY